MQTKIPKLLNLRSVVRFITRIIKRGGKLDIKWKPFYRILEKRGSVSHVIKNQLDGTTSKVQSEMLRLANMYDWKVPKIKDNRPLSDAAYVASDSE